MTTTTTTQYDFGIRLAGLPDHMHVSHSADLYRDAKASLQADLKEAAVEAHNRRAWAVYADLMFLHDRVEATGATTFRFTSPTGFVAFLTERTDDVDAG